MKKQFREPYFDRDLLPALEALFRKETSDPRTRSSEVCPLQNNNTFFSKPVVIMCECPDSHTLVKMLGENVPRCTTSKCPVRIVLLKNEG